MPRPQPERKRVRLSWTGTASLLLIAPLAGCSSTGTSNQHLGPSRAAGVSSEVNSARAYLQLENIQPRPAPPEQTSAVEPPSERASRKITQARKLIAQTRYTEAAIALESALRYDPNHPAIHGTLASLHWEAGNFARARTHATRSIEVSPDEIVAQYVLGRSQRLSGDAEAAIVSFRTALLCSNANRKPETTSLCHFHLAEALASEGYLVAALKQYDVFLSSIPGADVSDAELASLLESRPRSIGHAQALILEKLGRFGKAADALGPSVAASPDDVTLGTRFVKLLIDARRFPDALVAARRLPVDNDETIELLLSIHLATGHPERVVEDIRSRMADRADDPRLALSLAAVWVRLDKPESARAELQTFLTDHPKASKVRSRLIESLISSSQWKRAAIVAAAGIEMDEPSAPTFVAAMAPLAHNEGALGKLLNDTQATQSRVSAYLLGELALEAGRLDDALRLLQRSHAALPAWLPARVALARAHLRKYQYDEAIRVASRQSDDTPEDHRLEFILGKANERLDQPEDAERYFQASIQLNRSEPRVMFALAELYQETNRTNMAQRQLRSLLERTPDHDAARERLADIYVAAQKLDVAVEQLEQLKKTARSPLVAARCTAFLDYVQTQDPIAFRDTLMDAIHEHGGDANTWLALAQTYDVKHEASLRQEAFRQALTFDPENEEAALGLIQYSIETLAYEEAIVQQTALLRKRPNRHGWRLGFVSRSRGVMERRPGLIQLHWIVQDFEAALAIAKSAAEQMKPDDDIRRRYRLAILSTLQRAHQQEASIEQLKAWQQAEPDKDLYPALLASDYIQEENYSDALVLLKALHEKNKKWQSLTPLVDGLASAKQYDRAAQYLLSWLDDDPENDSAVLALSLILTRAERVDDALTLIHNRIIRTLARERFQSTALQLLSQSERYDEALDLVERLMDEVVMLLQSGPQPRIPDAELPLSVERVALLPNEPFRTERLLNRMLILRSTKINLLLAAKDYGAAQRDLTKWLDDASDSRERTRYLIWLARCHRIQGKEERAAEAMRSALVLSPDDIMLNNDIAYGLIDKGIRLDEAEPMIRSSVAKNPYSGAYLDTYGWLLYKQSDFAGAKKWLLRAKHVQLGNDPVIMSHLGDTLWRMGQQREAIANWEEALESSEKRPDDAVISADEKHARETCPAKIKAARSGGEPSLSPLALPPGTENGIMPDPDTN